MAKLHLPYVAWRDGRPRFVPGARERDLGFTGHDLRHGAGGRWFTLEEAHAWAGENQKAIVKARQNGTVPTVKAPSRRTVGNLLRDWFASDEVRALRKNTHRSYTRSINAILYKPRTRAQVIAKVPQEPELFASLDVEAIGVPELDQFIRYHIKARGLYMGRASRSMLSAAWHWGRKSTLWRLPHSIDFRGELRFKKPKGRIVVFTDAEIRAMLTAADALGLPSMGDSIMLGLFTGQRQGDRLALKDEGLVDGRRRFRQLKTDAIVDIPEHPALRDRLEAARARVAAAALARGMPRRPEIVVSEATGLAYQHDHYRKWFGKVRALAAQECPTVADKRDQDLRDTAVTWLARASCSLPEIASITGHSLKSIHQIMTHYLAITPELADTAIAKLVTWMDREGMAV